MSSLSSHPFSSLPSAFQVLLIQLLREECQPYLNIPAFPASVPNWDRAIRRADPVLLFRAGEELVITLDINSREALVHLLKQEFSSANQRGN